MKQLNAIKTQLNILRKELYNLLGTNATFQEIYDVSIKIDDLIVVYYREQDLLVIPKERMYMEKQVG